MTDSIQAGEAPKLGVGNLISETFSILGRNFLAVLLIGFVLTLISQIISGFLIGFDVALGIGEPNFQDGFSGISYFITFLLSVMVYGIMTAMIVRVAYDSKLNRPVQPMNYISTALAVAIPISILSVVSTILMSIGMVFLIVPGLWIYGVFYVMPAAVTIERVGFGGLGRSASLTKDYRWPIVGMFVLLLICMVIVSLIATTVAGFVVTFGGTIVALIVVSALNAVGYSFFSINTALVYARLREIKEGISVDEIASVFE